MKQGLPGKTNECYYCKEPGHQKKNCLEFLKKAQSGNKVQRFSLVICEDEELSKDWKQSTNQL
jgi:hypothetical protein